MPTRRSLAASVCLHGALGLVAFSVPFAILRGSDDGRRVKVVAIAPRAEVPVFFEDEEPLVEPEPDVEPELELEPEVVPVDDPPLEVPDFRDPEFVPVELDPFGLRPVPLETLVRVPREEPPVEEQVVESRPAAPRHEAVEAAAPVGEAVDEALPELLADESPDIHYPTRAQRRRQEGSVLLRITVAANGRVARVVLEETSGHAVLDDAALDGVREWRFRPGSRNGVPSTMDILHRVTFRRG